MNCERRPSRLLRSVSRLIILLSVNWINDIAPAGDIPPAQLGPKLVALNGPIGNGLPPVIHCFRGDTFIVPATFLVNAGQAPQVVADVFLDGGELGAPLTKAAPFQPAAASSHPSLLEGAFSVPLPDSDKPITLLVRLRLAANEGVAPAAVGQFCIRVTPKNEIKQALALMSDSARNGPELHLSLFGPLKGLRELLKEWKIPFDDEGMEMPVRIAAHTLAVGEAQDLLHLPQQSTNSTLLLIHDDPTLEAGINEKTAANSTLALLNTPRHEDWRQSPFLHQQLINQIKQHLQHHE